MYIESYIAVGGYSHDLVIEAMEMSLGRCPGSITRDYW